MIMIRQGVILFADFRRSMIRSDQNSIHSCRNCEGAVFATKLQLAFLVEVGNGLAVVEYLIWTKVNQTLTRPPTFFVSEKIYLTPLICHSTLKNELTLTFSHCVLLRRKHGLIIA